MMRQFSKNQSEVVTSSYFQSRESVFRREFTRAAMDNRQEHLLMKKGKRFRSAFTTEQVNYLEKEFRKFPYIGTAHRKEVANALNIPERAVKIWFQNRRMKEKKDTVIKEPEIDDQNNHKNVVFTNELLNNVPAVPSVNDQIGKPLPLLTSLDTANINEDKTVINHIEAVAESSNTIFNNEISPKQIQPTSFDVDYSSSSPVLKNDVTSSYKSSAEFSINLCKKYRNDLIYSSQQSKKMKFEEPLQLVKDKSENNNSFTQNVPEDLSFKKVKCKSEFEGISNTVTSNNVGFQPVYLANYSQPYMPATNMLWKPLNVVPVMSTGASAVTISSNLPRNLSVSQDQAVPKKTCNCDCHFNVSNTVNFAENPQNPQAQYIITAVPFQNYPKF